MPSKKQSAQLDLDSILDDFDSTENKETPAESIEDFEPLDEIQTSFEEDFEPVEDEEDAEIARLQAELAAPAPKRVSASRPKPESQLTEKEKKIRDLQDQLARKRAAELDSSQDDEYSDDDSEETILIHFLEDGFTFAGQVWYRGQELEFHVGGEDYEQTLNSKGDSWLDLDEYAQIERYGKAFFRRGPWRGKVFSRAELEKIAKETEGHFTNEEKRRRRVPLI